MNEKKTETIISDTLELVAARIKERLEASYAFPEATAVYCEGMCILNIVEGLKKDIGKTRLVVEAMGLSRESDLHPSEERIAKIIDEVAEEEETRYGQIVKSVPLSGLDGICDICGYTNPVRISLVGDPRDNRIYVDFLSDDGIESTTLPLDELPYLLVKKIYLLLTELP